MSESRNEPAFDRAPPAHRWVQSLAELSSTIRAEAYRKQGGWAWRVLPHGALVAMRVDPVLFLKELRIARDSTPQGQDSLKRWDHECQTFLNCFDAKDWTVLENSISLAGIQRIYREAFPAKADQCACGRPAEKGPFKEAVCNKCALDAGAAETARLAAERASRA